jgi:hypothetical protein
VADVADQELGWPFGATDGGPRTRPLVVHLDNVLVAVLPDTAAGERAVTLLREHGYPDERLRLYPGELIVAYDEEFRTTRGVAGKVVGAVVDDGETMGAYVGYGREGCAALWVQLAHRDDANQVIRSLTELGLRHVWFHGRRGLETVHLG